MNKENEDFFRWWNTGTRYGEKDQHCFSLDFTSDAWLAREAWLACANRPCNCDNGKKWKLLHEIIPCEPLNYCHSCGGKL